MAWRLARENRLDAAKGVFSAVEKEPSSSQEARIEALYGQAYCWSYSSKGSDIQRAAALYRRIIETAATDHPLVAWSDFEAVQAHYLGTPHDRRDYSTIAHSFMEVYRRHPSSRAGEEAYLVSLSLKMMAPAPDWEVLLNTCDAFIRNHPESPWVPQVLSIMASVYREKGDIPRQLEYMIRSLELMQKGANSLRNDHSTAIWSIAYISEYKLGEFRLAARYYQKLIEEYPRDNRVFLAQKALRRMESIERSLRLTGQFPVEVTKEVAP